MDLISQQQLLKLKAGIQMISVPFGGAGPRCRP